MDLRYHTRRTPSQSPNRIHSITSQKVKQPAVKSDIYIFKPADELNQVSSISP